MENLPADQTDTTDVPERPINRSKAVPRAFYQLVKQEITLKLDDYIIEWFKTNTTGAQKAAWIAEINRLVEENPERINPILDLGLLEALNRPGIAGFLVKP